MSVRILSGDCVPLMSQMEHESVDSIVTDPPYHFTSIVKRFGAEGAAPAKSDGATGVYERSSRGFMGKTWDGGDVAFRPETWAAALRVLKPGGHLVAFGAPKNYHRLACAIEDAGFEIRDSLMWVTGQGFPKSHNVTKNLDDIRCRCCDGTETLSERDLRRMRGADVPASEHTATERAEILFEGVSEQGLQGNRPEEGVSDDVRLGQPVMEGRGDLPEAPRQLRERPLHSVPAGVPVDGEGGRLRDGTPPGDGEVGGPSAPAGGMRSPQESPATGKRPSEPRTVAGQSKPQDGGAWPLCDRCGKPIIPDGLGTALKPAYEPIILARKPLIGTVAENVLAHGTGALNIDACRVAGGDENPSIARRKGAINHLSDRPARETEAEGKMVSRQSPEAFRAERAGEALGRWPANLVHDGSEEVLAAFPVTGPAKRGVRDPNGTMGYHGGASGLPGVMSGHEDNGGSAARFFYQAKASAKDRAGSKHPTVKPIALMRWLVRLITPPGGTVLDPFAGSGTTGQAAMEEGFDAVLIEREAEYLADIRRRLDVMPSLEDMLS